MTKPFCTQCAEDLLGPKAMTAVDALAASAPPLSDEVKANLRVIFQGVRQPRSREPVEKTCGHE
jgi:hypothetical protein